MNKAMKRYLIISFGWTWSLWVLSYLISSFAGHKLITDIDVFHLFSSNLSGAGLVTQTIFALAVFGPILGYLFSGNKQSFIGKPQSTTLLLTIGLPVLMFIPTLVISIISGQMRDQSLSLTYLLSVPLYFISNLLTSGTEEFGWRGYLYPALMEKNKTFWDTAWKGGFIWAVWHFPLMFYLYSSLGLFVLVPTLIGFTASIVAMNYITNFIYEKSRSILLSMILHALNNTVSFAVVLLFPKTPFVFLSGLVAWAIVAILDKKYKQ